MSNPFSGNTQNANMWDVAQIDEEEDLRKQLEDLEKQRNSLTTRIRSQEAQDEDAMYKLDEVVKAINTLTQQMKNKGFSGGSRKRHRRSKSCAKKSRRSKSRRSKSRRSKH